MLSEMTGAEMNSKKKRKRECQVHLGAKIVTAPTGAQIHSRLEVKKNPKFCSEYSFFGNFMVTLWI